MAGSASKGGATAPTAEADGRRPTGQQIVDSSELLAGGRELVIRHGQELYRLLVTSRNKLILTK